MAEAQVRTRRASNTDVTVHLSGDIDVPAAGLLRRALVDALMRQRPSRLLIDLDGVTSLDSTAVGALLAAADAAADVGVNLALCNASPHLARQLAETGLTQVSSVER